MAVNGSVGEKNPESRVTTSKVLSIVEQVSLNLSPRLSGEEEETSPVRLAVWRARPTSGGIVT